MLAIKAGEADLGLAVGVEKLVRRRPAGRGSAGAGGGTWVPRGRFGAVARLDGLVGTAIDAGVFAQVGMEYAHRYGGADFELFARIAEKNHSHSTLNPLAAYQKRFSAERDHGGRDDRLPEHPPHVLGEHRRRGRGRARQRGEAEDAAPEQRRRAVKISRRC